MIVHSKYQININLAWFICTIFLSISLLNTTSISQTLDSISDEFVKDCSQQDLGDFIRGDKEREKAPRKTMLMVLPNVSSNPVNGLLLGIAGSSGFYMGSSETTRVSSIGFNAAYTTKKQFLAFAKSNIYTKGDHFFLQGDWRYFIYNAPTWGLGTNAPDSIETQNSIAWQGAEIKDVEDGYKLSYNYVKCA
ncbi:MAG: hypothetical protein R2764_09850 [Bacteroidales bacterium]